MTRLDKISRLLRTALCLALMLCTALRAGAQTMPATTWAEAGTPATPSGSGSEADPFLIASAENLLWLSLNVGNTNCTVNGVKKRAGDQTYYYKQTKDIDLSGHEWIPIGNQTAGGFFGHYDGGGHYIKGVTVVWGQSALAVKDKTSTTINRTSTGSGGNYAFGLFGWFGGHIENLVIDNAAIICSSTPTSGFYDQKIGVLAGVVGTEIDGTVDDEITINNVIINKSVITDDGKSPNSKAYMVGGLIGDLNSGKYSNTSSINADVQIRNVAVDVDIALDNTDIDGTSGHQYNVGGIIGRMRKPRWSNVPKYSFYKGSINAPRATVGPVFGFARTNIAVDAGQDNFTKGYIGEFSNNNTFTGKTKEPNSVPTTIYFTEYTVSGETITDAYPAESSRTIGSTKYKARTLTPLDGTYAATAEGMKMFQGVNYGSYVANFDAKVTEFNTDVLIPTENYYWVKEDGVWRMKQTLKLTVAQGDGVKFTATVTDITGSSDYTSDYSYLWIDASDNVLYRTNGDEVAEILADEGEVIKVKLCQKNTDTPYTIPGTTLPLITTCKATKNYALALTSTTTTLPQTITVTATDKDGNALPTVSKHIIGTEEYESYSTTEFELQRIPSAANSINTTISLNGSQKRASLALDYVKSMSLTVTETKTIPFTAILRFTTKSGEKLNVPIDFSWDTFSSSYKDDILKSDYVTGVNPVTPGGQYEFNCPARMLSVSGTMQIRVVASYNGQEILTSSDTSLPYLNSQNIELDPTDDGKTYRVVFKANGDAVNPYIYRSGFKFDWRLTDDSNNTIAGDVVFNEDKAIVNDLSASPRMLKVKITDEYGYTTGEKSLTLIPPFSLSRTDNIITATTQEDLTLTSWTLVDANGKDLLQGLTQTEKEQHLLVSADGKAAEVKDKTFINRYVQVTATDGLGRTCSVTSEKIPAIEFGIEEVGDSYKAKVEGSTANLPTDKAYSWDIFYDDATKEAPAGTSFTPTKSCNATYTLVIKDFYGEWRVSKRRINDSSQKVSVARDDKTLTATVVGVDESDGTWEWRGISGEITDDLSKGYVLSGTGNTLVINSTNDKYNVYCAIWKSNDGTIAIPGYWTGKNIIYVYNQELTRGKDADLFQLILNQYPDGNNANNGRTPNNAVQTMARAYALLSADNSPEDNIIVIMGYLDDNADFWKLAKHSASRQVWIPQAGYEKDATITGAYGEISDGVIKVQSTGSVPKGISGATLLQNITLDGDGSELTLYANLHDLTIGNGVKVQNYSNLAATNGILPETTAPAITIIGGYHNYDEENLPMTGNTPSNVVKGMQTLTFRSGNIGRIIACARNDLSGHTNNYNTFGSPRTPHRVTVNVEIKHTKDRSGNDNKHEYSPGKTYNFDIGMLVGGQTDGTTYAETDLYVNSGTIGRFVAGNISYGRSMGDEHPDDGFYGSTTLTMNGGEIMELVGGSLGRSGTGGTSDADRCEAYFYGRAIININSGTINSNLYAAGTGGVLGFTDGKGHYTNDKQIPYLRNGFGELKYGDYSTVLANGKMPVLKLLDGTSLDLARSYCEININAGVVNGNIYGGGYGYTDQIVAEHIDRANEQSGNLYGNSYINIKGGTINGNVYGGGAGSSDFYNKVSEANKSKYESLANVYGDTHISVTGGIIEGKVYAGSKGIAGFPKMAMVNGNTNLVIEDVELSDNTVRVPIINGNIYGGSELGEITGNTNVEIKGGAIGNCIFGGSEGIETSADKTTAVIGGSTNVTITGGTYFTEEHIAKISADSKLQLTPTDRTFNIYGGGYRNCVISGSTNLLITKSLLASYKSLIEPDPTDATKKRSFEDCVNDRTYRKFSVYGAGRGELTDVKGDANLTVNIEGGASVPSAKPVDVANNQQFFMIAGGGMAGHVWGDTKVNLDGNVFARRVYGAGMYGNVLGNANMTVRRGAYYGVFGGGLLGNVKGDANLQIGTRIGETLADGTKATEETARAANRNLYIYENVYGGNDVSGCTGYDTTDKLWNDGNLSDFLVEDAEFNMTDENAQHHYLFEHWSQFNKYGKPYYRHLIRASEEHGVNMKICGGKILGDVFGAGNGNHTGYYVPNSAASEHYNAGGITRMMFYEGLPYHYRVNKKDKNSYEGTPVYDPETNTYTGTLKSVLDADIRQSHGLYEYRPRVGKVVMHIGGNSEADRVEIGGDVFGGGHACTIGKYDPARDVLTDPLRFEGGGVLKMNFGSHVTVKDAVYMGSRGRIIGEQTVLVKSVDEDEHYASTTLNSDYDYHYYDHQQDRYLLGFPNTLEGRMRFHAYTQLVNLDATTELTFYDQTDNSESKDVRWGSFYAGGARGSMTKFIDGTAAHPAYEYTLPAGLTVESRVVGGSEDAEITYYDYKEKEGKNAFTEIDTDKPLFTFYGGIVYDEHSEGHYGGGQVRWYDAPDGSGEDIVGDESPRGSLTVMKMTVNCQFDPQLTEAHNADWDVYKDLADKAGEVESDGKQFFGGLVYGGCYNSGITNGSVEVTCTGSLLGKVDADFRDFRDYLSASSLRRNVARVYGGGFGVNSTILGNTKVTLDGSFRGFNIFGGGMMGNVTGGTEVNVQGHALVYNAVYGGSMLGNVGKTSYNATTDKDLYAKGTHINVVSGGIDRVYGGAFMGEVYGGTHITASDEKAVIAAGETGDAVPVRLMVGSIYGGNDITGTIYKDENDYDVAGNANPAKGLSTYITVSEKASAKKKAENRYFLTSESKTEPGKFYAGYPMIGTIYGAGNGNMADYIKGVTIDHENECYNGGKVHIANGDGADYHVFDMAKLHSPLPNVCTSKIDITGGTIVNVYGGGSMCTTTESNNVTVHYADTVARATFVTTESDPMTWGILRLFQDLQQAEVTETLGLTPDGKPDHKENTYTRFSHQIYRVFGGNNLMNMAIQPTLDLQRGYIFSVYSGGNFGKMTYPNGLSLTINSPDIHISSVYGGGRVGDIDAGTTLDSEHYGATLNILDGLIGDVYGGNNVAGNVHNGTNVNIHGAISGNVYGSGNGNYIYLYDHNGTKGDPNYPEMITEGYNEDYGGRYFILPRKAEYGDSDEDKLLAINSYRPNVNKAKLNIHGSEEHQVYVLGNVYCGGNSSTVFYDPANPDGGDIKFQIGSYVTLGGVFLGSNGEGLANSFNISNLAHLNGIDDMGVATTKGDTQLYPNLLSLYMRAAEVTALPTNFSLPTDAVHSYIGNFCMGGNHGSMMTDKTIDLTIPDNLTIFGRIVGGCYNSRVEYQGTTTIGGMTKPLADGATDKVNLKICSKFAPYRMLFDTLQHKVYLVNDRTDSDGNYVPDSKVKDGETYYYNQGRCNIFGGCYTSGKTVGNIKIDLYSDVLQGADRKQIMNNVALRRTVYALTGGGYGPLSEVDGDIRIRLLPSASHHPSIATIFGGAHNGKHTGRSTTEIRDGMVFSSLYGGSRAAFKYGSSEVIVGYPEYYVCNTSGLYQLQRGDQVTEVARTNRKNHDGSEVIKQSAKYHEGDIVAANVVRQIIAKDATKAGCFTPQQELPTDYGTTWDNIDINIGDNSGMDDLDAHFYGGGGIYGGGHAINEATELLSGINTQLTYDAEHNPEHSTTSASIGYGGNSTIVVGDDPEGSREHISIGTGHYIEVRPQDIIGTYLKVGNKFIHQPSGTPQPGAKYYKMETQGGIFGDGRRTFVQGFRAVDITGYGYATHTPQDPKLINTFQRIDLLSLNDCCLQLQGAQDYATNTIDATLYSIARVSELRMNSSLEGQDIEPSSNDVGNPKLDIPRSRNYMAFFHNVHYIGTICSSTSFTSGYRGTDGTIQTGTTYRSFKSNIITSYKDTNASLFKQRNLGTAPNMVGINNGYTLKLQNAYTTPPVSGGSNDMLSNSPKDNIYYGPINGVVEVKLLTLTQGEGGGYIYAYNQHADDVPYLEDKGNFVFAGAISDAEKPNEKNYIVDDCYPLGHDAATAQHKDEETHYWYVQGNKYYFNTTLTAYTYNSPISFNLNNTDNLILLAGITTDTQSAGSIRVESVNWAPHTNTPDAWALTNNLNGEGEPDSRDNYKLYLTIDSNTDNDYDLTKTGNAFVAKLPNGDYGSIQTAGTYADTYDGTEMVKANSPLLGIRLYDTDVNNVSPTFYQQHLRESDDVRIILKARDGNSTDEVENTYTINLTITYLQGPYFSGNVNVENCALPGEYIYANTGNINMVMDDNLTITDKRWYLFPKEKDHDTGNIYWDTNVEAADKRSGREDVTRYVMTNTQGDINRLRLPARYYQNDWRLGYALYVNGKYFPLNDETSAPRITVHNYHRMSTVAKAVKEMGGTTSYYGTDLDLDLVGGALVYIESDEDFEIFTKYINYCNQTRKDAHGNDVTEPRDGSKVLIAEVKKGYNPRGGVTGFTNGRTIEGYLDWQDVIERNVKNPSGGENIRFVLTTDIKTTANCMPITEFRGQFNGNGHVINLKSGYHNASFITTNYGYLNYVGFVSSGGKDDPGYTTAIVFNNYGEVNNSYYYNCKDAVNTPGETEDELYATASYASLVQNNESVTTQDSKYTFTGYVDNCYQNTDKAQADLIAGLRYRTSQTFHNGMIAYNLNQEYLKARYNAKDNDTMVHITMMQDHDDSSPLENIDYLRDYYADGDYRYAYVRSVEHPEGVRLGDNFGHPNYEDGLGNGQTMHITDADLSHDDRRWFNVGGTEGYFPIYLRDSKGELAQHSDFIFFGQRLTAGTQRNYYPVRINGSNRVYRAGGSYGSRTDYGFHFNRDAYALQPMLTAIDFTGRLDLKESDGTPQYHKRWQYYMRGNGAYTDDTYYEQPDNVGHSDIIARTETDSLMQFVFYPPVLDLPGGDDKKNIKNLASFNIDSNTGISDYSHITKNLLVYTPDVDGDFTETDNERLFAKLHYTRMQTWGDVEGETDQNKIIGHQLVLRSHSSDSHFHACNGLFHLVDEQDFNAPIEFFVTGDDTEATTGRAWMKRKPQHYSTRQGGASKDAWESIALPFTCNRVVAVNSDDYLEKYSRGQITHFYGSDNDRGVTHHDYWLRGLVQTAPDNYTGDDVIASAAFARPGQDDGLFNLGDEQMHGNYTYLNNWFYTSYKDVAYSNSHNEYGDTLLYRDYCYLTKNAPYIVAFPGDDYYEFDLSGSFFNQKHNTNGCHGQDILYEFTVDEIDPGNNFTASTQSVRIPVTDVYDAVRHTTVTNGGMTTGHHATFNRITDIADNMYVLNTQEVTVNVQGSDKTFAPGSVFINCDDFGIGEILPFRTYLTVDGAPAAARRYITLDGTTRGIDSMGGDEEDEKEDDRQLDGVQIFVQGNALVVISDHDFTLPLYGVTGQLYCHLDVHRGQNVYRGLRSGVYATRGHKLVIRRL